MKKLFSYSKVNKTFHKIAKGDETGVNLTALWWGIITALSSWLVAMTLILTFTLLNGSGVYDSSIFFYSSGVISVIIGGIVAGYKASNKGFVHGLWVGLLLGLLSLIGIIELVPNTITIATALKQVLIWCIWGMIGGILGIKIKPKESLTFSEVRKNFAKKKESI